MPRCWPALLLLPLVANAQPGSRSGWSVGVHGQAGFLWPHRPSSWILVEGHGGAVELFAERRLPGDRPWQRAYNGPSWGGSVMLADLGDPVRIGTAIRIAPHLFLPFTRNARSTFGIRLGWGVGLIGKPYDRRFNAKQIAIGSRLNTAIQLMPEYRLRVGRSQLCAGISLDHWSNGSFRTPNLGLNLLSVSAGAQFDLGAPPTPAPHPLESDTVGGHTWSVVAAGFVHERGKPNGGQHSVFVAISQMQWRLTPKSAVAAGVDVFNKGSMDNEEGTLRDRGRLARTQLGVHGGYTLVFGRGELLMQMGAYLLTPVPDESLLFHRMGMRYHPGRRWVLHMALKSHFAVADHWEFGLGYRWDR